MRNSKTATTRLEDRVDNEEPLACSKSIRVPSRTGHFGAEVSPLGRDTSYAKKPRFARLPIEVLRDGRLNATDLRVFGELALACWGTTVSVGVRLLGQHVGVKKTEVARSLRRLIEFGHLRQGPGARGKRMVYVLESMVFGEIGYTQKSGVPYIAKMPKDGAEQRPAVQSAPKGWRKEAAG